MKCSIVKNKNTNYLRLEIRNKIYKFSPIWLIEHSSDIAIRDKQTNQLLIEAAELDLNLKINNFKIIKSTLSISFSNNSEHNYNINDLIAPKEYPKKTLWNSSLKKIPQYNFKKFNQKLLKDVLNAVD